MIATCYGDNSEGEEIFTTSKLSLLVL